MTNSLKSWASIATIVAVPTAVVLAAVGWVFLGSSNSAGGQMINNQGIITQGQSGGNNTVINQRPPRGLDDQGKSNFLSYLPDKSKPIKLMVLVGDPERDNFANQVADFLKTAGYNVAEPMQRFIAVGDTPSGTVIEPNSDPGVVIIKIGVNNR
jgi:hypothetical protein